MDYTTITAAANFGSALTAVGTVGAAVAVLLIGIRGARTVLSFIRR